MTQEDSAALWQRYTDPAGSLQGSGRINVGHQRITSRALGDINMPIFPSVGEIPWQHSTMALFLRFRLSAEVIETKLALRGTLAA